MSTVTIPAAGTLSITGETYAIRELLAKKGWRWVPARACWQKPVTAASIADIYATLTAASVAAEAQAFAAGDLLGYAAPIDPATLLGAEDLAMYRAHQAADRAAYIASETV